MIIKNRLVLFFLSLLLITLIHISPLSAGTKLKLAEIDPDFTDLNVYRSYQYKLFIIGIIHKPTHKFDCTPNRYIFYHYDQDQMFQISAGDLLVNPDFTHVLASKVYKLDAMTAENELGWKLELKRILKKLNTSSEILEQNKISGSNGSMCWQQPELFNTKGERIYSIPILAANSCDSLYCFDMSWKSPQIVQFWSQISPEKVQKIEFNADTKQTQLIKSSKNISKQTYSQINAPRDRIVDPVASKNGSHTLINNQLSFFWQLNKDNKLVIGLDRKDVHPGAADKNLTTISRLLALNDLKKAYQQIRFGLWLSPDHFMTKYSRLKLYYKLSIHKQIFKSIKTDFKAENRIQVCQKIHTDDSFKGLWKKENTISMFKQTCF